MHDVWSPLRYSHRFIFDTDFLFCLPCRGAWRAPFVRLSDVAAKFVASIQQLAVLSGFRAYVKLYKLSRSQTLKLESSCVIFFFVEFSFRIGAANALFRRFLSVMSLWCYSVLDGLLFRACCFSACLWRAVAKPL